MFFFSLSLLVIASVSAGAQATFSPTSRAVAGRPMDLEQRNGSQQVWMASGLGVVARPTVASVLPASVSLPETLLEIATARTAMALSGQRKNYLAAAIGLVLQSMLKTTNFNQIIRGYTVMSSRANVNLRRPSLTIYPAKGADDAPYDVSEEELRSSIHIPSSFTYGVKKPVILVPGTGVEAGAAYAPNFGKSLAASDFADPVYLNVPGHMADDIQSNAQYVAYAINYISGITGRNVTMLGWSQASLATRWATKYWPSTREVTASTIDLSPDYHGTWVAYLPCPRGYATCSPAALQQQYHSAFIATLRNGGGDSAYVPTTTVYSMFDEVVQPQRGRTASGYCEDVRNVGVTNIDLQEACGSLSPGGTFWNSHGGVLFNALAAAAATDAIKHGGAANMSRIDVAIECSKLAADGLTVADVLATEASIPIAGFNILNFGQKKVKEPLIKRYARKDIPPGYGEYEGREGIDF